MVPGDARHGRHAGAAAAAEDVGRPAGAVATVALNRVQCVFAGNPRSRELREIRLLDRHHASVLFFLRIAR